MHKTNIIRLLSYFVAVPKTINKDAILLRVEFLICLPCNLFLLTKCLSFEILLSTIDTHVWEIIKIPEEANFDV